MTTDADRAELIEHINNLAVIWGEVTLASGRVAPYYVDLRRVTLDGAAAPVVGRVMRGLVDDLDFDAVGGLTLGADPVALAMVHAAAAAGGRLGRIAAGLSGDASGAGGCVCAGAGAE